MSGRDSELLGLLVAALLALQNTAELGDELLRFVLSHGVGWPTAASPTPGRPEVERPGLRDRPVVTFYEPRIGLAR